MINKKNILILVIALIISFAGYKLINKTQISSTTKSSSIKNGSTAIVPKLSPQEFKEVVSNPNTFTIDVHTPEQKHIPGTDVLISYDKLKNNLDKLPEDKNTPIAVYCRSGSMSEIATQTLLELGYTNVVDLEGGINNYKKEITDEVSILPLTKDLGEVIYGDVETTQFKFTNFTSEELKITRVSTSCGCTSAKVVKDVLAPYETTIVNVSFDPAVHKDDTDLGELTRTIYIETNNDLFSKIEGTITANVIKK